MKEPTALYRFYDKDDVLLYVGISKDWFSRFHEHRQDKNWITQVTYMKVQWYSHRFKAGLYERLAIRYERPLYNKASVVAKTASFIHFQEILDGKLTDQHHLNVMENIDELLKSSLPHMNAHALMEWALANAFMQVNPTEDEYCMECDECNTLGNSQWLQDGHYIICEEYRLGY